MIWIDFENRFPTDTDIVGWEAWPQERWDAWLARSDDLVTALGALNNPDDLVARNQLIDDNKAHWGELKPWLAALSGGKCWFSETRDLYSHYDVEHFRPKKSAKSLDGTNQIGRAHV